MRYYTATIRNVDNKIISLSDGTRWETNRFVIAPNLSDVFVVLEEYLDVGNIYISNTIYSVKLISGADGFRYSNGFLDIIESIDSINFTLKLNNGSVWFCGKKSFETVKSWLPVPEIIVSANKSIIINPRKFEYIEVKPVAENP